MTEILKVHDLAVSFDTPEGEVQAVRGVTFSLKEGEVLALVGESGCGKSVLCKSIMKLLPDTARIRSGSISVDGTDITGYGERDMRKLRGRLFSMVFQDPMTSLNPTMTIGSQIAEAVRIREPRLSREAVRKRVLELMELVGIQNAESRYALYPHHFSGGMRQRSVMAIALAARPRILFADEPTTALDVTIQAQILDLFRDIQKKLGTTTVLVSHDLGMVARVADRVAVMYAGKIVETGTAEEVFYDPRHPYTWGLLRSLPAYAKEGEPLYTIPGMPPTLLNPPPGDAFAERNEYALEIDYKEMPPMFQVTDTHFASTWLLDQRAPAVKPPVRTAAGEARPEVMSGTEETVGKARPETMPGSEEAVGEARPETVLSTEEAVGEARPEAVPGTEETVGEARSEAMPGSGKTVGAARSETVSGVKTAAKKAHPDAAALSEAVPLPDRKRPAGKDDVLLDVRHLTHQFRIDRRTLIRAADDLSFQIRRGEIFGLVGESGSGKSTVARCIMNIYRPADGQILYHSNRIPDPDLRDRGIDILDRSQYRRFRRLLCTSRQLIFQDSASSLNQRMKIADIVAEPMVISHITPPRGSLREEAAFQLHYVGMDPSYLDRYPAELSGGMRQRAAIARALSMEPELLVADEPVASLDVSIQAQIINLFRHLQEEHGFTFLFIAHDLSVVRYLCDRVGVMVQGKLVEIAPVRELFENPIHPYTKLLLSSIPVPDPRRERERILQASAENHQWFGQAEGGRGHCRLRQISEDHYVYQE